MTLAVFLCTLGAALRLTRLAVEDSITSPWRDFLARRSDTEAYPRSAPLAFWFAQLFECPWCIGFWVSAGLTAIAAASDGQGWYLYPAIALSISYLVGVAATVVLTIEEIN